MLQKQAKKAASNQKNCQNRKENYYLASRKKKLLEIKEKKTCQQILTPKESKAKSSLKA